MNYLNQVLLVNDLKKLDIDVPENEMKYRVGNLSAVDDDEQDKHVFNLVQSANDMFLLEGNILKVLLFFFCKSDFTHV
jgi:hypothetical protein